MATQDYKLALDVSKLITNIVQLLGKIGVFTGKIFTAIMSSFVSGVGIVLGVIGVIIAIGDWLKNLDDLKKGRDTCYGMYRRIRSLLEFTNPNEICYKHFSSLTSWTEKTLLTMREFLVNRQQDIVMNKKLFVPADFNSFILYQNILSWIDLNEAIITANNGAYCDYIEFVSLRDYIDTNKVFEQDKARLEILILDNNVDILTKFLLALETLKNELLQRFKDKNLTDWTKQDISYCLENTNNLLSIFNQDGELYHNLKSQIQPQSDDIASIMLSIFRYLDYGYGLEVCGYDNLKSLYSQDEILSGLPIDNYVSNDVGFEWILDLLRPYMVDYGIIIFNDIYIKEYKSEIEYNYLKNPKLYNEKLYNDIIENIDGLKILSDNYYQYNVLLQSLKYFFNKDYLKINSTMVTYYGYNSNNEIVTKIPDIKTYVTFNYKDIYNYILSLKQTNLYDKYFELSELFKFNQSKTFDLCGGWLEDNTYHFSTAGWYDKGRTDKRTYTFKELLNFPYTTEEYFKQVLNNRNLFALVFVNAFQVQNSRYNCGYLRDTANRLFDNGYNLKKINETQNIINICKNDNRYYGLALYGYTNKQNKFIDEVIREKGLYQLMWESYLETYGRYGFDIINSYRDKLFKDLLNQDIELVNYIIREYTAQLSDFEIKYNDYSSIFADQTTGKDNQKIFNLSTEALKLERSNFGKYAFEKILVLPNYIFDNGTLYFNGFIQPIDILKASYKRTEITDLFYALNQVSFDKLFEYADGNFFTKLMLIDEAYSLRADNYELIAKYEFIIDKLKEKSDLHNLHFTKDDLINSFKQETIEDEISYNQNLIDSGIVFEKSSKENELIASQVNQKQAEQNIFVDKKLLKKYTLYGILGLGLVKIFRR